MGSCIYIISSDYIIVSIFFQLYIFTISVYALVLTIRQLFNCTKNEWQGKWGYTNPLSTPARTCLELPVTALHSTSGRTLLYSFLNFFPDGTNATSPHLTAFLFHHPMSGLLCCYSPLLSPSVTRSHPIPARALLLPDPTQPLLGLFCYHIPPHPCQDSFVTTSLGTPSLPVLFCHYIPPNPCYDSSVCLHIHLHSYQGSVITSHPCQDSSVSHSTPTIPPHAF